MQLNLLKAILSHEFGKKYKSATLQSAFFGTDGKWHGGTQVSSFCSRHRPGLSAEMGADLATISKGPLCGQCVGSPWSRAVFDYLAGFSEARHAVSLEMQIKSISKLKGASASAVQKRLSEIPNLNRTLKSSSVNVKDKRILELYKKLENDLEEAQKQLKSHSQGDKARRDLERRVQQQLVPSKYRAQSFELDSTMMLIGISPGRRVGYSGGAKANIVNAVIDAYSIRSDDKAVVLYAPAYFYSFLLGMLYFKGRQEVLVVSATDPGSSEARDNAAHLWDPQNDSVLACLSQATATGTMLSD